MKKTQYTNQTADKNTFKKPYPLTTVKKTITMHVLSLAFNAVPLCKQFIASYLNSCLRMF